MTERLARACSRHPWRTIGAWVGAIVSLAIVAMKVVPWVPGSFTRNEWIAFLAWSSVGLLFWVTRTK